MTTILQHNTQQDRQPSSPQPVAEGQYDEFDSAAYANPRQALPYLQLLNQQDPDQSGFFITSENAATVNFRVIVKCGVWERIKRRPDAELDRAFGQLECRL